MRNALARVRGKGTLAYGMRCIVAFSGPKSNCPYESETFEPEWIQAPETFQPSRTDTAEPTTPPRRVTAGESAQQ